MLSAARGPTGFLVRKRMRSDVHFYITVGEGGKNSNRNGKAQNKKLIPSENRNTDI